MKSRRHLREILVALIFLSTLENICFGSLHIEISLTKGKFLVLEPVLVHFKVTNTGDSAAEVERHELGNMFVVRDKQNRNYPPQTPGGDWQIMSGMAPGESEERTVNLLGYGKPLTKMSYTPALPKGVYRAHMEIRLPSGDNYLSNVITFEVIEPSGSEKIVMSLILEADSLRRSKQKEASYRKMLEVYRKYPNSIYNQYAFFRASIMCPFQDKTELIQLSREFIEKNPDSHYANDALNVLVSHYQSKKDKAGAKRELLTYVNKFPNMQVSKSAQIKLNSFDKMEF